MTRLTLALAILLPVFFTPAQRADAQIRCWRVEITFTADEDTEINGKIGTYWKTRLASGWVDFELDPLFDDDDEIDGGDTVDIGSYEVEGTRPKVDINENEADADGDFDARIVDCDAPRQRALNDGRLNANAAASPAAIYPTDDGYAIYAVDPATGNGARVLDVTNAQVGAALATATSTGANTQIAAFEGISLWALTSNECQMNAFAGDGALFEFVFGCAVE